MRTDFTFTPSAEPGHRFAPAWRQGSPEGQPDAETVQTGEGREGALEAKRGAFDHPAYLALTPLSERAALWWRK